MALNMEQDRNPYITEVKRTYKEALLSQASDTSNRLGIHSFQLMHLLKKRQQENEETDSIRSDTTNPQTNLTTLKFSRMRFQITLTETSPDTFMEDLADHINKVLEVININTPGVLLAPWHKTSVEQNELLKELKDDPLEAVKYLYGFKAGMNKPGPQYLRIHIAFPSLYSADDIVRLNKNSIMIPGKQTLLTANSQCIHPFTLGWLLRSTPTMADFKDLEAVLKAIWQVKGGFGLYWATVKDGKPYNATTASRAIHIEVEETEAPTILKKAEKTYGRASTNMEDYPLGINMMFVQPYNEVKGSAKAIVAKLAMYQHTNEQMLTSASWFGEMALERSIDSEKFISLRQWLMAVSSLHEKYNSKGHAYKDKLFTSIHRSNDSQEVKFYFCKVNEMEATNVLAALPLFVQDELSIDPSCFFHRSDYKHILEGSWDKSKREYRDQNTLNQEQYLMELEDCFNANREFLPQTIVMDAGANATTMDKQIAMANGEDDVSILSTLTDKTLKEATRVTTPTAGEQRDDNSISSGMTSKSKTQLAVRSALKEVSVEHNKAMEEQRKQFQLELDRLRRQLDQHQSPSPNNDVIVPQRIQEPDSMETENNSSPMNPEETSNMDVDDSSNDEASLSSLQRSRPSASSLSVAKAAISTTVHKRPTRSKTKISKQGRSGSSAASNRSNV